MKTCLVVIDGYGISPVEEGNAVHNANTPVLDSLAKEYPSTEIAAHGLAVGLPEGQMGNSEVGHLNIGAGRVVEQDIVRINKAIHQGTLCQNEVLQNTFAKCTGSLHLIGILSDGGVHGHINHLLELVRCAKKANIKKCFIHCFGDGVDTAPKELTKHLETLQSFLSSIEYGEIATITGRYYVMTNDSNWDLIQKTVECIAEGKGEKTTNPLKTVEEKYAAGSSDEFIQPLVVGEDRTVQSGDTLLFFNYRADRMRKICSALNGEIGTIRAPSPLHITTMTQYKNSFTHPVLFDQKETKKCLAECVSLAGKTQLHVSETEKYAHMTFFLNGRREEPFEGETRILIPSPNVATYDLKPEMSTEGIKAAVCSGMASPGYDFIVCNFAATDMVGHTGVYSAAICAVEAVDGAIGEIKTAAQENGYALLVISDHGNAEKMLDCGGPHKAHTTSPVPFIAVCEKRLTLPHVSCAALCDVAPTVLFLLGIDKPSEMSGSSLLG
ncbi:MAG: cofactor-independent phosphoglycerate mutase [Amphiamblys sp. WSBS2006]|nr:MAG: cofactor-independent phosphoglycerate mutase [Amphiamblys sp. WSBS2006]